MNDLKNWVLRSREEERRHPERYIRAYSHLPRDAKQVFMTPAQLVDIEHKCGRYDRTLPTGVYLGKVFLRGEYLCWYSIAKDDPMRNAAISKRIIQFVYDEEETNGPGE